MGVHPVSTPGLLSLASPDSNVYAVRLFLEGTSCLTSHFLGKEELELAASVGFVQSLSLVSGSLGLRLQLLLVDLSAHFLCFSNFPVAPGTGAVVSFAHNTLKSD